MDITIRVFIQPSLWLTQKIETIEIGHKALSKATDKSTFASWEKEMQAIDICLGKKGHQVRIKICATIFTDKTSQKSLIS